MRLKLRRCKMLIMTVCFFLASLTFQAGAQTNWAVTAPTKAAVGTADATVMPNVSTSTTTPLSVDAAFEHQFETSVKDGTIPVSPDDVLVFYSADEALRLQQSGPVLTHLADSFSANSDSLCDDYLLGCSATTRCADGCKKLGWPDCSCFTQRKKGVATHCACGKW